jgi:CO/xanthine dehydrogenase FAD-binding subunit
MKPAVFEYAAPKSISETMTLLGEHGYDAKILAGGQSLMPVMNMRLAQPSILIDINGVEDMSRVEVSDDHIVLGATVRQQRLIDDAAIAGACPLLNYAAQYIAHRTIRNRGTIGGSLVHADPASELPALMVALDATMTVLGPDGEKEIPAGEFFVDYMTVNIGPDELLTSVKIPRKNLDSSGWGFVEFSRRHGDFAIVAAVALLNLDDNRALSRARLVITGVGATPHVVEATDQYLGQQLNEDGIKAIAKAAANELDPQDDIQGTSSYRRRLARVLSKRVLNAALERCP